jgi:hypothetical protein
MLPLDDLNSLLFISENGSIFKKQDKKGKRYFLLPFLFPE